MTPVNRDSGVQGTGDVEFGPDDFARVRQFIRAKAGIELRPERCSMVYGRLVRHVRERGHRSFRSYLDVLQTDPGPQWQEFVNRLTTNFTSFFREPHHFEHLALQLRRRPEGPWRIWSCAASTGEEPCSIAITAIEALGDRPPVRIDATDIDTSVLAQARDGIYALDAVAVLARPRHRFLQRGKGVNEGLARVAPSVLSLVSYRPFNLLSPRWDVPPYDIVFCRNVMIYFDRPTQRQVLERLHGSLVPEGLLYAGHAENLSLHRDLFRQEGRTVYRRVALGAGDATPRGCG